MRAMRLRSLLLAGLLLPACSKKPELTPVKPQGPGRPADVCAWAATVDLDCTRPPPDGSHSDPAGNCYDVGNQLFHCGLFAQASRWLQKSAELKPDPHTFHALGDAYFLNEQWQQAHDAFQKAVELKPDKRESWVRLAQTDIRLESPADAHAAAARAKALDPNKPDAMRVDADAFSAEGDYDKALDELRKAEPLGNDQDKKNLAEQQVQIAQLKLRKVKRMKAQESVIADSEGLLAHALEFTTRVQPPSAQLYRDLADARLASGDLQAAEDALDQAAKLDPQDFISPRMVGFLREQRGDSAGARSALQASLQVRSKQAMPHIILGRLDLADGQSADAKSEFAKALDAADGRDPIETRQLAELAYRVGESDKALALYKTLDDDPDLSGRVGFWLDQARVAHALSNGDEVKAACKKANAIVESATCPPAGDLKP